jgi:hypothetical protein
MPRHNWTIVVPELNLRDLTPANAGMVYLKVRQALMDIPEVRESAETMDASVDLVLDDSDKDD